MYEDAGDAKVPSVLLPFVRLGGLVAIRQDGDISVELHPIKQTPYAKPTDLVFPLIKENGRGKTCASLFCADHLHPAAKAAGVIIPAGHRWGQHNLRHSLSNRLVNKAKGNPKTVQGILGHSRIQTTFDLYTDEDLDEMIAAQEKFLDAWDSNRGAFSRSCGWDCG